jgi:Zn-dependent membrane protease YugP
VDPVQIVGIPSAESHLSPPLGAVLGVILLILGFVLKISILWTIGIIVLIIGVVFFVLGSLGHAVGGRKYWY